MNRFKIKAGIHNEDGVTYGKNEEAGDIVTSPYNLVAMFPEKFEDLGPVSPRVVRPQLQTTSEEEDEEPEEDEDEHLEARVKTKSAPSHKTTPSSTSTKKTTKKRSHHKRRGDWE